MDVLLILPLAIPLGTAVLTLLLRSVPGVQRLTSVLGAVALLGASGTLLWRVATDGIRAAQMGGWPAPFGITLVADPLSAGLLGMTAFVAVAVAVYALAGMDEARQRFGFHPLFHLLLMGVNGAFITGDMFNLYVWFEVLLIASFVLLVLGNERRQLDGAVKYVGINLASSIIFLAAVGLLYGHTGTLNMADASGRIAELRGSGVEATLATLFIMAFGIKAALFPLFFWLPAAYHTPPAPVAAVFAGLLTKVGIYSLIRVFSLLFPDPTGYTRTVLLVIAAGTMVVGVMGAMVQRNVHRLLAFLVISAMGYILMGLGFFTTLGLVGAVFYILQDVPVKTTLFLIGGMMERDTGTARLGEMGGLYQYRPVLAAAFMVPAFSLAGFPPFPGFWGKLTLVQAGLEAEQFTIVAVALIVGLFTLLVVAQIWSRAFWRPATEDDVQASGSTGQRWALNGPIVALAVVLLAIGLYAQPLYGLAEQAAANLVDTQAYVDAVLGPSAGA
jgi:multicomponent Na+:H+ antiporter subunit D